MEPQNEVIGNDLPGTKHPANTLQNEIENIGKDKPIVQGREELAEALHKGKLPSLRTYQGDIAQFIQSKDKSIADIAIKNREVKEKQIEEHVEEKQEISNINFLTAKTPFTKAKSASPNFLIYTLGIFLGVGSLAIISYIAYIHFKNVPIAVSISDNTIIRSEKSINLDAATLTRDTFFTAISEAENNADYKRGITAANIVDTNKNPISTKDFMDKIGLHLPSALDRSLGSNFIAGVYGDGLKSQFFIVFKVNDYGIAFRDMLAWENEMPEDFAPILNLASSTQYGFKDLIVKNKDTRALTSDDGVTMLLYTFLDQNTILITKSDTALSALVNSFTVGNVIR